MVIVSSLKICCTITSLMRWDESVLLLAYKDLSLRCANENCLGPAAAHRVCTSDSRSRSQRCSMYSSASSYSGSVSWVMGIN